jgi:hypothetical protein
MGFRYDPKLGGVKGSATPAATSSGGFGGARKSGGVYTSVGGSKGLVGPRPAAAPAAAAKPPTMDWGKMTMPTPSTPTIAQPERPQLPPIAPVGEERPEHAALRERYTGFGEDIKAGTGFAMDVLEGQQQDRMEAQIEQAREQHAALGIPFDEKAYRAELQRGVNAAMAGEKLGREQLYQAHLSDIAPVTAGAEYAQAEKGIDLQRDVAEQAGVLDRYGIDVGKYSTDVQAAARANEMLMDFYKSLMGGMMNFGPSYSGGSVRFG